MSQAKVNVYVEGGWVKVGRWLWVMQDGLGGGLRVRSEFPSSCMREREYMVVGYEDLGSLRDCMGDCVSYVEEVGKGGLNVVNAGKKVGGGRVVVKG